MSQPVSLSDKKLLHQIKQGNATAFEQLYQRYGDDSFHYLIHLTGDVNVAEDLLQESWLAVWQQAGQFRGDARVKSWLLRIAHNQAVSWWRQQKPDKSLAEAEALLADDDTEETALQQIADDQLIALLEHLSPDHRAVIELIFFHQLSYEEAAQVIDCPVGTVKSRIAYARRHLKALSVSP